MFDCLLRRNSGPMFGQEGESNGGSVFENIFNIYNGMKWNDIEFYGI